jgi:hypothetical protein
MGVCQSQNKTVAVNLLILRLQKGAVIDIIIPVWMVHPPSHPLKERDESHVF